MIKTENLCKSFGDIKAANNVSLTITDNSIFGLAGTNGAGKSTLLRMLSGVLKQDSGKIAVDGSEVYENLQKKSDIFFLPDTAYFFQTIMLDMAKYFAIYYPRYDVGRLEKLADNLELEKKRKISTFSKGMKRQASMLLGICAGTKYLSATKPLTDWTRLCGRLPKVFWHMKYQNGSLPLSLLLIICGNWRTFVTMWDCCTEAAYFSQKTWRK